MKGVILFVVTIYVSVKAQNEDFKLVPVKPEKCYGTDEIMDPKCCVFPPFYVKLVARACGALFALRDIEPQSKTYILRRNIVKPVIYQHAAAHSGLCSLSAKIVKMLLQCEHWECILEKYALLDDAKKLDVDKFYKHLDRWVELNPKFAKVMIKAKRHCIRLFKHMMPLTSCEYYRFHICHRHFVDLECPDLIKTEVCQKQKLFYDECRQYFY